MRRLLVAGLVVGVINGSAAALSLYLVHRATPDAAVGWFAYAPLNENVVFDYYGSPWEYVVVPAVLIVLNAVLLPLAGRRGWLREQGPHSPPT